MREGSREKLCFISCACSSGELTKSLVRYREGRSDLRQVHLYRPCTSDIKYLTLERRKKPEDLSFVTRFAPPPAPQTQFRAAGVQE